MKNTRYPFAIARVTLLATALFASVASSEELSVVANEPNGSSEKPNAWYHRALVGLEVGPTGAQFGHSDPRDTGYCVRFHGAEIVRASVKAGSQYLVIWVRDGDYAYYDSKLLPKAPGLGERDALRETMDEAEKHGLPIIAYCVVQQGGHFLKSHPEWEMRGADGRPIGRFCYNSGYLEAMKEIVAEQLAYGIAGFHIDMVDQGFGPPYGCWCETCREKFRHRYGHDMPGGATWDAAWDAMLEFRYDTSEQFEKMLFAHIKSIDPRATVDYNYHGNPPFSFEVGQRPVQHAGNADFVTGETGVWGFSALGVGLNAEFYRASTPGKPFQVAMQRGVRMYHDQTTRPLNDLRWELMTLLAHGAFVTVVDKTAFDGSLDPVAYERFRESFAEARQKRAHFGHPPVYDVGIYFSSRTRDWFGRDDAGRYFQSFQGAHRMCVMEHLQFGAVLDENATRDTLRQFPVVILPNAAIVSPPETELFEDYVRGGGNLIITGHGGQFDRFGAPQATSSLAPLIGAEVKRALDSRDNWVRLERMDDPSRATLADAIRTDWPFLVEGPATVYEPSAATAVGKLLVPHRTARQLQGKMGTEWPMSADKPVGPAVLINKVGKGTVLTLSASPDFASASEHPVVEARKLLRNAVRLLHPHSRVHVSAPANVEAVVTDDPANRTLRVHLIAYNATPQTTPPRNRPYTIPGLIEDKPLYRVRLDLNQNAVTATAFNPATSIQYRDRQIEAIVEDIHEVITIEY